ncbi:MAG: cation:proton antiporter [Dehalococcoidia bacterium]
MLLFRYCVGHDAMQGANVHGALILDLAVALTLALGGGLAARALRLSPIVGYLAAGIVIGPFTPGYRAEAGALHELAQIGVVFLMFGVGLHFNLRDLAAVRTTALPAGVAQIVIVTAVTWALGLAVGLGTTEAAVLGMAASISSTVVLVRALEERGAMTSATGRLLVGWLIVQDLATIAMLVLLPVFAGGDGGRGAALVRAGGAAVFVVVALTVGTRLVPGLLRMVGRTGSRELFVLVVVCLSLGIAVGAELAGASLALGAFIAGIAVSETEGSHQAASDVLPLRDAFAVLFFVSVGMLIDPAVLLSGAPLVLVAVLGVVVVKALVSGALVLPMGIPPRAAFIAAAGLGQAGEFSFILADAARGLGLLQPVTYQALLAASAVSVAMNPLAFRASAIAEAATRTRTELWRRLERRGHEAPEEPPALTGHVVIVGAGRVGRLAGTALERLGVLYAYIDASLETVIGMQQMGRAAYWGDAAGDDVLRAANVQGARLLVLAVPDAESARLAAERARALHPGLAVVARAHSAQELELLRGAAIDAVVVPEFEGAAVMLQDTLALLGVDERAAAEATEALREAEYGAAGTR